MNFPVVSSLDKGLMHVRVEPYLIILLELVALLLGAVAADGADVDHAVAELDEGAALDRDVEVGDVAEDEVDEFFEVVLAQELLEGLDLEELSGLVGDEAVLGEDVVVGGGGCCVFGLGKKK